MIFEILHVYENPDFLYFFALKSWYNKKIIVILFFI